MSFFKMLPEPYQVVKKRAPDLCAEDGARICGRSRTLPSTHRTHDREFWGLVWP